MEQQTSTAVPFGRARVQTGVRAAAPFKVFGTEGDSRALYSPVFVGPVVFGWSSGARACVRARLSEWSSGAHACLLFHSKTSLLCDRSEENRGLGGLPFK